MSGAPRPRRIRRDAGARPDHVGLDPGDPEADCPSRRRSCPTSRRTVDAGLDKVLTDDQKKQLKQMRADFARGGGPGGPGRPGGGGPPAALFARPAGRQRRSSGPTGTARTMPAWPART